MSRKTQDASRKSQDASHKTQDASSQFPVASSRIPNPEVWTRVADWSAADEKLVSRKRSRRREKHRAYLLAHSERVVYK